MKLAISTILLTLCTMQMTSANSGAVFGRSDNCSSSRFESSITVDTNCDQLPNASSSAWSISINGECRNISDTNVARACKEVKGELVVNGVYGRSDSCGSSTLAAAIDQFTDCDSLSNASDSAWSIKVNGECRNISDTNVARACKEIRSQIVQTAVYGRSDNCSGSTLALVVDSFTQCDGLANGRDSAWSIKVNGECRNISDTTIARACKEIQGSAVQNAVFGRSDNCSPQTLEAPIDEFTDCDSLTNASSSAWSVKIDGECRNISDTTVARACKEIKGQSVRNAVYGRSDSCGPQTLEASINAFTDCAALANSSSSAWSIKVDGECRNISDTNVERACNQVKSEIVDFAVYGRNDNCSGSSLVTAVDEFTICSELASGSSSAWSIKVGGSCINISDTTVVRACEEIQSRGFGGVNPTPAPTPRPTPTPTPNPTPVPQNRAAVFSDQQCGGDSLEVLVLRRTNCSEARNAQSSAGSIFLNGNCRKVRDMSVENACMLVKRRLLK